MLDEQDDLRHQIRAGSLQHHILRTLKDLEGKDAEGIWGMLLPQKIRLISLDDLRGAYLKVMKDSDLVTQVGSVYSLTINGYAMLNFLNLKADNRSKLSPVKKADLATSGSYSGEELKATCDRKGAYDFLGLPSRIGNALVPHPTAHLAES
jgi:hypothetical protein